MHLFLANPCLNCLEVPALHFFLFAACLHLTLQPLGDSGRWVGTPKGADSMAASGLGCRKALVGTGWAISLLLCMNQLKNSFLACGASISDPDTSFQSSQAVIGREPLLLRTC